MLCVGSFEDTACYALQSLGYRIVIDPSLNVDMAAFRRNAERLGTYEIVFSTSVIEHVPDDERSLQTLRRCWRRAAARSSPATTTTAGRPISPSRRQM